MKEPVKQVKTRDKKGRWKEGTSGNPKGRPVKKLCIADLLKDIGDESYDRENSNLEKVLRVVYDKAISGDMKAIEFIAERTEGRAQIIEKQTYHRPIDSVLFIEDGKAIGEDKEIQCYDGI